MNMLYITIYFIGLIIVACYFGKIQPKGRENRQHYASMAAWWPVYLLMKLAEIFYDVASRFKKPDADKKSNDQSLT